MQVLDAVDILRADALLVHLLAIILYVIIDVLYLFDQALALQRLDLLCRHRFHFRLIIMIMILIFHIRSMRLPSSACRVLLLSA